MDHSPTRAEDALNESTREQPIPQDSCDARTGSTKRSNGRGNIRANRFSCETPAGASKKRLAGNVVACWISAQTAMTSCRSSSKRPRKRLCCDGYLAKWKSFMQTKLNGALAQPQWLGMCAAAPHWADRVDVACHTTYKTSATSEVLTSCVLLMQPSTCASWLAT